MARKQYVTGRIKDRHIKDTFVTFLRHKTARKRHITWHVEYVELPHLRNNMHEFRTYLHHKTGVFSKYLRRKTTRKRHITERVEDENRRIKDVFVTLMRRKTT